VFVVALKRRITDMDSILVPTGSLVAGAFIAAACSTTTTASFIHIFMTDSDDTPNGLGGIAAFAEFQRELTQRCVGTLSPRLLPSWAPTGSCPVDLDFRTRPGLVAPSSR
jgi:hypothetical protein